MSAADIRNPAKLKPAEADRICLTCHLNQPTHVGRINSSHAKNQVSCVGLPLDSQERTARPGGAQARRDQRAVRQLPHRRLGQLPAPLQAPPAGRRHVLRGLPQSARQRPAAIASRRRDANEPGCFNCHGDKRGPFTFEHAPVRLEGCTACHEPHGSANPRMLTRHEVRFVCLECHSNLPAPTLPANGDARARSAGVSRSAQPALPELHPLPPEGAWLLREPGLTQMRFLLAVPDRGRGVRAAAGGAGQASDAAGAAGRSPPTQAKPAEAAKPPTRPPNRPAPATEQWITGSFDFGYRWVTDVRGNFQQYRSVVNLGEGPKLFGLDFTITGSQEAPVRPHRRSRHTAGAAIPTTPRTSTSRKTRHVRLHAWTTGTSRTSTPCPRSPIRWRRAASTSESFDTRRRNGQLRPATSSRAGTSCPTWRSNAIRATATASRPGCRTPITNSPYPTLLRDSTNNYRGGVRFEFNRFHVTLEQGGTTFKDDDQADSNGVNTWATARRRLGQTLALTRPDQAYGIRGSSIYSQGPGDGAARSLDGPLRPVPVQRARRPTVILRLATGNFALLSSTAALQRPVSLWHGRRQPAAHDRQRGCRSPAVHSGCGSSNR